MATSNEESKIKKIIAPDYDTRNKIRNTFRDVSYYVIIALVSILVIFVIPLVSGALYGDFSIYFPKSVDGWIVYCSLRGGSALANVALFVLFKQQAKMNIRDDPNYLEAKRILEEFSGTRFYIPRSPKKMNLQEYIIKLIAIVVVTLLTTITISSLIISFDFITFLSCLISTFFAVCLGWITMIKNEIYWTDEYLEYAKWVQKQMKESAKAEELPTEVKEDQC